MFSQNQIYQISLAIVALVSVYYFFLKPEEFKFRRNCCGRTGRGCGKCARKCAPRRRCCGCTGRDCGKCARKC